MTRKPDPWFRQGWPWFIIAFPAVAVIAGFVTLWLAIVSNDGLVVDDYYKQGLAIKQTMERSEKARSLGLTATVRFNAEAVSVDLQATDPIGLTSRPRLILSHPTRAGSDQIVSLDGGAGHFTGRLAPLASGRWDIQIEDESRTWRLNGVVNLPTETVVRISPVDSKPVE